MKKFTTRFLLIGLVAMLCFSQTGIAQQKPGFATVTGTLIRTTPKLADIDRNSMYGQPFVITRNEDGPIMKPKGMEETEERLEEQMRERIAREYRIATKGTNKPENVQKIQAPITANVPGTSLGVNFDGGTSPGLQPTDNNMAAGPNHVIQVVNNTSGTRFTIWDKAGNVVQPGTILSSLTGRSGAGDPIVLYDQLADRWFMAEFGPSACCSELIMAVSVTGNPTGAWKIYNYIDASFFPDYPKFSVWHNAYYAYTNDFNSAGTAFLGTSVWAFDRAAMLAGAPTAVMVRQRLSLTNMIAMSSIGLEGMVPSTQNGMFVIPTGATTLSLIEVTPNFGVPSITVSAAVPLTVNAWATGPGSVPMQSGGTIQTLSPRLMFKSSYRNNSGTESIVCTNTIANGGLAAVRWYELRRVAGNWTVFQQGTVTGSDGNSRFMPGISMDGCGNIALMYDLSGTTSNPSVKYTGRNASDPLGTMTLPEATIINAPSGFGGFRWGDYNTTVQDYSAVGIPNNGSFWSTSQYGNQLTRIANFSITGGCAAAPNLTAGTATIVTESCVPNNGVIDPGETVSVSFCVQNVGTANTTNAVGTLLTSGGVITPSGPQNYGVIVAGGPAVCRTFTFTNNSTTCGATITASLQMQDGATNLGTLAYPFTMGTTVIASTQNFDAVVAPALPAGWTATNAAGGGALWVTSSSGSPAPPAQSAPNALFIDDPALIADKQIVTPAFVPGAGARATFGNNFDLESGFDGGVLEISINGGAFNDIVTAGGSFVAGGYTGVISTSFGSLIGGRNAWTGSSGGFSTTTVNLPVAAAGQSVRLRFRMGSDNSVGAVGWRVDNFQVTQPSCCGTACVLTCPANITVNSASNACGANVSFAATATGLCGPITYSPASGSFFPVGTTTVNVSSASGSTCSFTVTVVDATPPTITCPAPVVVGNTPGLCSAVVTYALPSVSDNCPLPGQTLLTQSAATSIVPIQIGCQAGGLTTANSWWRAYDLAPLALGGPFTVRTVTFGIETANATSGSIPVTVKVHTSAGAFPGGTRTQVASQTVNVPNQSGTLFTVTLTSPPTVPANSILCFEIAVPDGRAPVNHTFFIGSNASGQTGPSYLQATDCGAPNPTDLASLGFPNDHIIINASGTIPVVPPVLNQTAGIPSGGVFPVGVTTNTFTARDAAGLTSTCSFTVTVNDTEQPTITCPGNSIRNTDVGQCYATFTPAQPTFADNCSVTKLTWSMVGPGGTTNSPATGINYVPSTQFQLNGLTGVGVTTITYTATDAAGNTRTCSFTVTVNDAWIPVINSPLANQFVCVGSNGAFTINASVPAGNPLTYQWQKWDGTAWVDVVGGTNATLPLPNVQFSQNTNSYRVKLRGRCSEVISNYASLYVNRLPSVVLAASRIPILLPGESVNLVVTVDPAGGVYEWFKDGSATPIPGVTGASYNGLTVDDIGDYKVRYTDQNGCVSTSNTITVSGAPSGNLWVYPNPNFGQFSVRFFNQVGESATVTVFDAKGARVYQRQMITTTPYTRLDVDLGPTTNSGVYLVEVVNSAGKSIGGKRVIVRHP